jgi:hypothetical protein
MDRIQMTNTGNTMVKKDKGQTQAIHFHDHCVACVCHLSFLSIVWPVVVLCLFCPLHRLCLSFVFLDHCVACVCHLSSVHCNFTLASPPIPNIKLLSFVVS